jgi:hypothetical protein
VKVTAKASTVFLAAAEFSSDRLHRYRLDRAWDLTNARRMVVIGLNPSTADELVDDPTIRRCIGFAKRENCGGLIMVNLYTLRATNPADLKAATHRGAGSTNDDFILAACKAPNAIVLAAWGSHGSWIWTRAGVVDRLLRENSIHLYTLGLTRDGQPRHPLYVKADVPLQEYPLA